MDVTSIPFPKVVSSDKDTHFTGALATNAIEAENLTDIKARSGYIESVTIQSDQNLDWDLFFWATDGHEDATDYDNDYFLGKVVFVAADGERIAGAGQYYYSTSNSSQPFRPFPYIDKDAVDAATGAAELHIGLVNRNSTSKSAGASGEVVVRITYRPDEAIQSPTVI